MRNLLPTETVILKIASKTPPDDFGQVKTIYTDHVVENCLVQAGITSELQQQLQLNLLEAVTVHIPASFNLNTLAGKAIIRGNEYNIISSPIGVTESPLIWNRSIICERVK